MQPAKSRWWLRSWPAPAGIALLLYAALVVRVGAGDGFRFYGPLRVSGVYAQPGELLPGLRPQPGTGYDGQFYFFIAQDPFLRRPDTAASLDSSFRFRRILYPLLAWTLSLGRRGALPVVMILVNLAACALLVALCARAAAEGGRSPWSALAVAVFGGVWIPLLLDLTEPVQLVLLVAGFLVATTASSAALLLLAALAKETAVAALGTELLRAGFARRWRSAALHLAGLVLFAAWTVFVQVAARGAHFPVAVPAYLSPPGAPLIALVVAARQSVALLLITGSAVAICLLTLVRLRTARDGAAWAAAAYALVCLGADMQTWGDPTSYFRVIAGAAVLAYVSWCRTGDREGWLINALAAGSGLLTLAAVLTA